MKVNSDPGVKQKFRGYPKIVKSKMNHFRKLILEAAESLDSVAELEETLKWNEPSYLTKKGSTIRMDWKAKKPDQYAVYFKCTSKLVPTFKEVYGDLFTYEGNRAIVFQLDEKIPEQELKNCLTAGLQYHLVKQLPDLGMH